MSELKACPFCGAGARLYRFSSQSQGLQLWVQCETCSARAQEFTGEFGDDPEQNALRAVAAWSDRPEEDRLRSEIEVLKARVLELENLMGIPMSRGEERLAELREKHVVKR